MADLRVAPESHGKVAVTLPQDWEVPVLGRNNGWLVVNYRHENRYRRLYLPADAAELPPTRDHRPGHVAAQRWSDSHSRICGEISGARTATKSFAAAALFAGAATLAWHVYVDKDVQSDRHGLWITTGDRYRPAFAVWAAVSVGAVAGAVYSGIRLSQAKSELAELGWPRLNNGGIPLPGLGRARGDLVYDPATRRQALMVNWRP